LKKRLAWVALATLGILALPLLLWAGEGLEMPPAQSHRGAAAPASDRLYVLADYERVAIVDGASGTRQHELPMVVLAADGSVAYARFQSGGRTQVRALDATDGRELRMTSVEGLHNLPRIGPLPAGLSPNGRWLALQALPGPEREAPHSRFVVLDTAFEGAPRQVDLEGVFEFDALDDEGRWLYLIEYGADWSAAETYRVRRYDLERGALDPAVIADKRNGDEEMVGQRQAAVASPDGRWLYSLYLDAAGGLAFIHALNLVDGYALCIDLPVERVGVGIDLGRWGLVGSPEGDRLYAVHGGQGLVFEVDTASHTLRRRAALDQLGAGRGDLARRLAHWLAPAARAKIGMIRPVALSPDGQRLYAVAEQGILVVDTATLIIDDRFLPGRMLSSLALSPDGGRLYALEPDPNQVLRLDASSGQLEATLPSDDLWWGLLGVRRVAEGSAEVPGTCPVTVRQEPPFAPPALYPPEAPPPPYPLEPPNEGTFWYGTEGLWTAVPDSGHWPQLLRGEKVFWWSAGYDWQAEPEPDLEVDGRRLDGEAPALVSSRATNAFHPSFGSAMLVMVEVPTPGCWEITGHYGGEALSIVVRVAP
jgi:hypothetical protein